jgi:heavy metal efflux system protein
MLNSIIRFSIKNKLVIGIMTIALMLIGLYQLQHLPIDAVPDITDNQVQVITISPALGAPFQIWAFIGNYSLQRPNRCVLGQTAGY